VPTLGGLWRAPDGSSLSRGTPVLMRAGAYVLVAAALAAGTYLVATG
jgi:hypothetical protein